MQVREVRSDALFILLVEKDAAFMRLAEDRFYNTYPCIILTAKGQPDVATRHAKPVLMAVLARLDGWRALMPMIVQRLHACWPGFVKKRAKAGAVQALPQEAERDAEDTCAGSGGLRPLWPQDPVRLHER